MHTHKGIFLLLPLFILFPFYHSAQAAEFRTLQEDRGRVESLFDEAARSANFDTWQDSAESGAAALQADWERDAERRIDEALRSDESMDEDALRASRNEALAEWKEDLREIYAQRAAQWFRELALPEYPAPPLLPVKELLEGAADALSLEAWQELIDAELPGITEEADAAIRAEIDAARRLDSPLADDAEAAYSDALDLLEAEALQRYRMDRNTLVYDTANGLITRLHVDTHSLRRESEARDAAQVTGRILDEVEAQLDGEKSRLFGEVDAATPEVTVDIASLGADWQEELQDLVTRGMDRWEEAGRQLTRDMEAWQKDAALSYEEGEKEWRRAWESLLDARDQWRRDIEAEIDQGISAWQETDETMRENLDQSREDLARYMTTLQEEWYDHASEAASVAGSGGQLLGEADRSIQWYGEMAARYEEMGAYDSDESDALRELINRNEDNRVENTIAALRSVDQLQPRTFRIFYDEVSRHPLSSPGYFPNEYYFDPATAQLSFTYLGPIEGDDTSQVTERYRVTISARKYFVESKMERRLCWGDCDEWQEEYYWTSTMATAASFIFTNTITEDSPEEEKSAYYYYRTEERRWRTLRDQLATSIEGVEGAAHAGTMYGDGGPGYLANSGDEEDPYLMTDAEFAHARARREKEYRERQLAIARAVYEYSVDASGRDDAESTTRRKDEAKAAMDAARSDYRASLDEVSRLVEEMQHLQQGGDTSMATLSEELDVARRTLEERQDAYAALQEAVLVMENRALIDGEGSDYLIEEIEKAQRNLTSAEEALREAEAARFIESRRAEGIERQHGYLAAAAEIIPAREEAKKNLADFESLMAGDFTASNIRAWADEVAAADNGVSGDDATFASLRQALLQNESGAEEAMAAFLVARHATLTSDVARHNAAWQELSDAETFLYNAAARDKARLHTAQEREAAINLQAFTLLRNAADTLAEESQTKEGLLASLEGRLSSCTFGEDNDRYLATIAALEWARAMLADDPTTQWRGMLARIEAATTRAEGALLRYTIPLFDPEAFTTAAHGGDPQARALLEEYYTPGSGEALAFIAEYLRHADRAADTNDWLSAFRTTHGNSFLSQESRLTHVDYAASMESWLDSSGVDLSLRDIESYRAGELITLNRALQEWRITQERSSILVPEAILHELDAIDAAATEARRMQYLIAHAEDDDATGAYDDAAHRYDQTGDLYALYDMLTQDSPTATEALQHWQALDADFREALRTSDDATVTALAAGFDALSTATGEEMRRAHETAFADGALTTDQYLSLEGGDLSTTEKDALRLRLLRIELKKAAHADMAADGINDVENWCHEAGLSGGNRDALIEYIYSEKYIRGDYDGTDFAALPEEAQYRRITDQFMREHILTGDYLFTDDAKAAFLDGFALSGDLHERARAMIDSFDGVIQYLGENPADYTATLEATSARHFAMMRTASEDELIRYGQSGMTLSGAGGITERATLSHAMAAQKTVDAMDHLIAYADAAQLALADLAMEAEFTLAASGELVALQENPGNYQNWRHYLREIDGVDTDEDTGTPAIPGISTHHYGGGTYRDTIDGDVHYYTGGTCQLDNGEAHLEGMLLDAMNDMAASLERLREATPMESAGFSEAAEDLAEIYYADGAYTTDIAMAIASLLSEYDNRVAVAGLASLENIDSAIDATGSQRNEARASIRDRGTTLATMEETGSPEETREALETARINHREATDEVTRLQEALAALQAEYANLADEYQEAMATSAERGRALTAREHDYDLARAVYEYAHTPYLQEDSSQDAGATSGTLPGGGTEDLSTLPAPDATERLAVAEESYNHAIAAYNSAADAVAHQETVVTLQEDDTYSAYREAFEETAAAFTRAAQVNEKVLATTAELKQSYEEARAHYERARAASPFTSEDMTTKEKELRDILHSHIIEYGAGTFDTAVNRYWHYQHYATALENAEEELPALHADLPRLQQHAADNPSNEQMQTAYINARNRIATLEEKIPQYRNARDSHYAGIHGVFREDLDAIAAKDLRWDLVKDIGNLYRIKVDKYRDYRWKRHRYRSHGRFWRKFHVHDRRQMHRARDRYHAARNRYNATHSPFITALVDIETTANALNTARAAYVKLDQARSLSEIREILTAPPYGLEEAELALLYDESTGTVENGVNVQALRTESPRLSLDGRQLKAEVDDDTIYVLKPDGTRSDEWYAKDDASVILRADGAAVNLSEVERGTYEFSDAIYSISEVTTALRTSLRNDRTTARSQLMAYAGETSANGTHDDTVLLRDLEGLHWQLLEEARDFMGDDETSQRSYEGYQTLAGEIFHSDDGSALHDRIVSAWMDQRETLQEDQWARRARSIEAMKRQWMETAGFIHHRGEREWTGQLNSFENSWKKWRIATSRAIDAENQQWKAAQQEYAEGMNTWQEELSDATDEAALREIARDAESRIATLTRGMDHLVLPEVNVATLLAQARAKMPATLGALATSMEGIGVSMGITDVANLQLNDAALATYRETMRDYEAAMKVQQHLRSAEILHVIMEDFAAQLADANAQTWKDVAQMSYRYDAPFVRRKNTNQWTIDVITSYTLFGKKTATRRFDDYRAYQNDEIQIETMEGTAGEIDFNDPVALAKLDPAELEASVRLMSGHLQRQIDAVWASDGLYSRYVEAEYARMGDKFSEYYIDYREGITMADAAAWNMPVVDGGPSALTIAKVAGSMALSSAMGPMGAFLVNTMAAGINVADGTMAWQVAALQMGTSLVTAGMNIGLEGQVSELANTLITGSTNHLMSGIEYTPGGGWNGFTYNNDVFKTRNLAEAGLQMGATHLGNGTVKRYHMNEMGLSAALVRGTYTTAASSFYLDKDENLGDVWKTGAINTAGNYLGQSAVRSGTSTTNAYSQKLMNNFATFGARKLLGSNEDFSWNQLTTVDMTEEAMRTLLPKKPVAPKKPALAATENQQKKTNRFFNFLDTMEETLGGIFVSMGRGLGQAGMKVVEGTRDALKKTGGAIGNFFEKTVNLVRGDGFINNEEVFARDAARYRELMNSPILYAANGDVMSDGHNPIEEMAYRADQRQQEMDALAARHGFTEEMLQEAEAHERRQDYANGNFDVEESTDIYTINAALAGITGEKPQQSMDRIKEATGVESAVELQRQLRNGEITTRDIAMQLQLNYDPDLTDRFSELLANNGSEAWSLHRQRNPVPQAAPAVGSQGQQTRYIPSQQEIDTFNQANRILGLHVDENGAVQRLSRSNEEQTTATDIAKPIKGGYVTQEYRDGHKAIDISTQGNDLNIYAARSGVITLSRYQAGYTVNGIGKPGAGQYLIIKNNNGTYSYYMHMERNSTLPVGTRVIAGQTAIGRMGNTGSETRRMRLHLHYEERDGNWKYINPTDVRDLYRR